MGLALMSTHSLIFSIPGVSYRGSDSLWVEGTPSALKTIGSLQAFSRGKETLVLPEGLRSQDARVYYSKDTIPLLDEYTESKASSVTIDGKKFYAFDVEHNVGFGLVADHYKYYLLRKPLNTGG